ncbi:MAG: hypothetical protein K6B45_04520 [Bacteroidaceae bacterium]|nr:hypothetical protein [Bacteroidaceae bacterium]
MKPRFLHLFIPIVALTLAACEAGIIDNAVPTQNFSDPVYWIEVSQTNFKVASDGGELSLEVYVSDNLPWQATTTDSWVTLSQTSGKGNATIKLTVLANETGEVRQATVTIKAREKSASVTITQEASPTFSVTPTSLSFGSEGGAKSLTITSNQVWNVSTLDWWLTLSVSYGSGDGTLSVTASENTSTDSRIAAITFLANLKVYTVSVTQEGAEDTPGGEFNGHAYVDLGLPSGILWATCNVGANNPEDYGDYLAWGETTTKTTYDWSSYKWCNGSNTSLTKYNTKSSYGTVDNKTVLDLEDDAAHVNWGGSWRMPTDDEWTELRNNCTWTWTSQGGHNGDKVTSKSNGNSIFLPAAGYRWDSSLSGAGEYGYYLSSSLNADYPFRPLNAYFYSGNVGASDGRRDCGDSVRPVCRP